MTSVSMMVRKAGFAVLAALMVALAMPALSQAQTAQQPLPSVQANDAVLLNYLQGRVEGRISIPDANAATLIQPQGREWRAFHQTTLKWIGGIAILGMLGVLVLFALGRGRIAIENGWSGRFVVRFGDLDRFAHWLTATCFVILGLTGLNIVFGKDLLLPLIGAEGFTLMSQWGKYAHNFLSFPFMLGVVLMFVLWVKDNLPSAIDMEWLRQGGGLVGHGHPPAKRFNAGQKLIFWSTVLGGTAISVTGLIMMFPFQVTDVAGQQLAVVIHGVVSLVMIGIIIAHIYIGSVGMQGAFGAMGSGRVDYNWAKMHHNLWLEDEAAKGRAAKEPIHGLKAGAD